MENVQYCEGYHQVCGAIPFSAIEVEVDDVKYCGDKQHGEI